MGSGSIDWNLASLSTTRETTYRTLDPHPLTHHPIWKHSHSASGTPLALENTLLHWTCWSTSFWKLELQRLLRDGALCVYYILSKIVIFFVYSKFFCWSPLHPKSIHKANPSYNWVFLSDRNDLSSPRWLSAWKGKRKVCLFTLLSELPRSYPEVNKCNALFSPIKQMDGMVGTSASWPEPSALRLLCCPVALVSFRMFLSSRPHCWQFSFGTSFSLWASAVLLLCSLGSSSISRVQWSLHSG